MISKEELERLMEQAQGDWDYLVYLLKEYWKE